MNKKRTPDPIKVLFVDDQVALYESNLVTTADNNEFELSFSSRGVDAILRAGEVGVLVLDLEYPGQEDEIVAKLGRNSQLSGPEVGVAILEYYHKYFKDVPVIIVTQNLSDAALGRCIQLGVIQYLDKDRTGGLDCAELKRAIEYAVELVDEKNAKAPLELSSEVDSDFITHSKKMRDILKHAARLANSKISILLLGESGVGKERLASFIHSCSDRSQKPFEKLNIGTLNPDLLGSELFGHVKGAFTGANSNKDGLFRTAGGGTIFLDEIGAATAEVQVRLLRVLQEGTLRPVGSDKEIDIDVRIISATNGDLTKLISAGEFREDLYYRLKGDQIIIPPLRERREDIPPLAVHFANRFCRSYGLALKEVSNDAIEGLSNFDWPGNVRELEKTIERTVILVPGLTIRKVDLSLATIDKPLGKWKSFVDELAIAIDEGDATARRFMDDLDILVYDRLFEKLGSHTRVSQAWGKDKEAMTQQRQRWAGSLAKQILSGQRSHDDVPVFLKEVCQKYLEQYS